MPLVAVAVLATPAPARAQQAAGPDALVRQISTEVIDSVKSDKAIQAGDINKILSLVDTKVMPSVNFEVVTRSAVGPKWREATPEQRTKLQSEFKTLLVRVYAGALTQIRDQKVEITRTAPVQSSTQVVVQSEVRGTGEPIKLDYRLDKFSDAWKIIDVNVGGIWLVQSYRSQFAQVLGGSGGIDALITRLVEQNKTAGGPKKTT
ncbi:MAG: ABC transporter substrate-binding protein [Burkholderiales bacterium]|nr:ABC transporter substrate-binding protein [Burkholderiales bacterium]